MASIKSDSYSLSQLFLEPNTLRIPKFQRDYSWTKDQIIQFFEDAEKVLDEDIKNYFFGSIVLIEDGTDILEIVDGQQRIATVLVLLILIRDILREEGSDKGIESADDIQRYIYSKKFASMKESKLILNKNND